MMPFLLSPSLLVKSLFLAFKTGNSFVKPSPVSPGRKHPWHLSVPIALGVKLCFPKHRGGKYLGCLWSLGRQEHRPRKKVTYINKPKACTKSVPCVCRGWAQGKWESDRTLSSYLQKTPSSLAFSDDLLGRTTLAKQAG